MKKIALLLVLCSCFLFGCTGSNTAGSDAKTTDNSSNQTVVQKTIVAVGDLEAELCNQIETLEKATFCVVGDTEEGTVLGSGVIYRKIVNQNGTFSYYLLTNKHVVEGVTDYKIYFGENSTITADLLGTSEKYDLAVLTFSSITEYGSVEIANIDDVVKGEYVIAMGTPLSQDYYNTATIGNVSNFVNEYVQHTAFINSGNSGGPLIDLNGKLVGINTKKISQSSSGVSVEGMYFAIKCDCILEGIGEIEAANVVKFRPVIGITITDVELIKEYDFATFDEYFNNIVDSAATEYAASQNVTYEKAKTYFEQYYQSGRATLESNYNDLQPLNQYIGSLESGVFVRSVDENGPAFKLGMQENDIIISMNGVDTLSRVSFATELNKCTIGQTVTIKVMRNGVAVTLEGKI